MNLITRAQAREQGLKFYFTGKACKYGHISDRYLSTGQCLACRQATYFYKTAKTKQQLDKEYYQRNRDTIKKQNAAWKKANKGKVNSYKAKRKAQLLQAAALADWDQIRFIYENCPEGHHVDHIEPLQGVEICGLHVSWNLQYLTASENCSKGNQRFP